MSSPASCASSAPSRGKDDESAFVSYKCFVSDCFNVRAAIKETAKKAKEQALEQAKKVFDEEMKEAEQLPSVKRYFDEFNAEEERIQEEYDSKKKEIESGIRGLDETSEVASDDGSDEDESEAGSDEEFESEASDAESEEEFDENASYTSSQKEKLMELAEEAAEDPYIEFKKQMDPLEERLKARVTTQLDYMMAIRMAGERYAAAVDTANKNQMEMVKVNFDKSPDHQISFHGEIWINEQFVEGRGKLTKDTTGKPAIEKKAINSVIDELCQRLGMKKVVKSQEEISIKSEEIHELMKNNLLCDGDLGKAYAKQSVNKNDALLILNGFFPRLGSTFTTLIGMAMISFFHYPKYKPEMKELVYLDELCGGTCLGGPGQFIMNTLKLFVLLSKQNASMQKAMSSNSPSYNGFNISLQSVHTPATRMFYQNNQFKYMKEGTNVEEYGRFSPIEKPLVNDLGLFDMKWFVDASNEAQVDRTLSDYFNGKEGESILHHAVRVPKTFVADARLSERILGRKKKSKGRKMRSKAKKSKKKSSKKKSKGRK